MNGFLVLVALAAAASANAQVINIDQAKALAGGITSGDAPGFPITIAQPGSYRLTSNLITGSRRLRAIEIRASNVSLDLGGFSVVGERCAPGTCLTSASDVHGITTEEDPAGRQVEGVVIRNGQVIRFNGAGIRLARAQGVSVEDVQSSYNRVALSVQDTHDIALRRVVMRRFSRAGLEAAGYWGAFIVESSTLSADLGTTPLYAFYPPWGTRILISNSVLTGPGTPNEFSAPFLSGGSNQCNSNMC